MSQWRPETLALHDPLTGLPNRLLLQEFLAGALGAARNGQGAVTVLMLDIDNFTKVNERYGFGIGDQLLVEIADRLRQCVRDHDLLARVGADEFMLVAPGLEDRATVERLCTRLQSAICAPFVVETDQATASHGSTALYPQATLGVALSPKDAEEAEPLLECARLALEQARLVGPGVSSFFSTRKDVMPAPRSLDGDLRRAILHDQFVLVFQPRWITQTRDIVGVEALIRWDHPELGRLNPDDFVPLAEKNGLIIPMGEWALREACTSIARLPDLHVSVNVSAVQFRNGGLAELVETVLEETGLPAQRLELEITETVLIENFDKARQVMEQLKALGVRIAMDDFGSGYSSLGYLRSFPFDTLKIDRRFIDDLDRGAGGLAIIQAILGLGKALGMHMVAEGVETETQLAHLVAAECDEVQGFFLGSPHVHHGTGRPHRPAGHAKRKRQYTKPRLKSSHRNKKRPAQWRGPGLCQRLSRQSLSVFGKARQPDQAFSQGAVRSSPISASASTRGRTTAISSFRTRTSGTRPRVL